MKRFRSKYTKHQMGPYVPDLNKTMTYYAKRAQEVARRENSTKSDPVDLAGIPLSLTENPEI
jgi:hypothetical protein